MGSKDEVKKLIHLKVTKPEVESLKGYVDKMTKIQRLTFDKKYGKILELLGVDVQIDAITALAQFYDPPMRCFTFRDFQMAPTLEEFAQILGYPLENIKPYQYTEHDPSMPVIAEVLKVQGKELQAKKLNRNGFDGFSQKYLEERMKCLAAVGDWSSFMDVLALTVYGVVLFPHLDGYIDFPSINVFLAYKDRRESPVPAVLANTYYTFHHCHEKKGKKILCCLSTLYVWLVTHMFDNKCKVSCPIGDFKMCNMRAKDTKDWARSLANLNKGTVRWYPKWQEIHEVIYQCGSFPNVPLIGTMGYINYNPSVALRQLGYPIMSPPTAEMIDPIDPYGTEMENSRMLKRIRQAWNRVIRKSGELGKKNCDAAESYHQWVRNRAQEIKLPFESSIPAVEGAPVQTPVNIEEVKELKTALLRAEEKNKKLEEELVKSHHAYKDLQFEYKQKEEVLEKASKRARVEEECKRQTQSCLWAANEELGLRGKEKEEALMEVQRWKESATKSQIAEKNVRKQLEDLKLQLKSVVAEYKRRVENEKQDKEEVTMSYQEALRKEREGTHELKNTLRRLKRVVAEHQKKVDDEKKEKEEIAMKYQEAQQKEQEDAEKLKMYEETINLLWQESMSWRGRYVRILWEAREVPRRLKEAEEMMNPPAVPAEISDFFEFCKSVLNEVREVIGCNHQG